jgi:hypothetical protein
MSMRRRFLARACAAAIVLSAPGLTPAAQTAPVRGIYNWIHGTGDAERAFAFYHEVFGIELARSPFAGPAPAGTPPEPIRPAAQAGSDPLVWNLTNTPGSRFRTVFMRAPNTPVGLELSEFFTIARGERVANPWDPGASALIFLGPRHRRGRRHTESPRRARRDARRGGAHNPCRPRHAPPRSGRLSYRSEAGAGGGDVPGRGIR